MLEILGHLNTEARFELGWLGSRGGGIAFNARIALDPSQVEGLIWRLLATLGGGCASGEMLQATLSASDDQARLHCDMPTQLLREEDVFAAEAKPVGTALNAGPFGAGFSLRLARAEARSAGGDLVVDDDTLILTLPLISDAAQGEALPGR